MSVPSTTEVVIEFHQTPMLIFRSETTWHTPEFVRVRPVENEALSVVRKKKFRWWHIWVPANGYTLSGSTGSPTRTPVTQEYIDRVRRSIPPEIWNRYVGEHPRLPPPSPTTKEEEQTPCRPAGRHYDPRYLRYGHSIKLEPPADPAEANKQLLHTIRRIHIPDKIFEGYYQDVYMYDGRLVRVWTRKKLPVIPSRFPRPWPSKMWTNEYNPTESEADAMSVAHTYATQHGMRAKAQLDGGKWMQFEVDGDSFIMPGDNHQDDDTTSEFLRLVSAIQTVDPTVVAEAEEWQRTWGNKTDPDTIIIDKLLDDDEMLPPWNIPRTFKDFDMKDGRRVRLWSIGVQQELPPKEYGRRVRLYTEGSRYSETFENVMTEVEREGWQSGQLIKEYCGEKEYGNEWGHLQPLGVPHEAVFEIKVDEKREKEREERQKSDKMEKEVMEIFDFYTRSGVWPTEAIPVFTTDEKKEKERKEAQEKSMASRYPRWGVGIKACRDSDPPNEFQESRTLEDIMNDFEMKMREKRKRKNKNRKRREKRRIAAARHTATVTVT
jgi:hypothetical protein